MVAAVGRRRAVVGAQALAVRGGAVGRALVAGLRRVLQDAVAAVAGERAVRVAGAVAAVVLAVVALLVAVLDAVAAVRAERAVGVAVAVAAGVLGGAVVALLARVERAVAALERAVGVALVAGRAVVHAVVALLAVGRLQDPVAAARAERAAAGAVAVARAVGGALVALLAVGDDAVAAVGRPHAAGAADLLRSAVGREVGAVVALLLGRLDGAVAAVGPARHAAGLAPAVGAVVGPVVADLVAHHDAVAADRAALADRVGEAAQREGVRRAAGVALGLEEVDRVHAPVGEAQGLGLRGVERDAAARGRVQAAEVDGQVAVDEGPHVVVAGEAERGGGARRVRERVVQLAGERVVVGVVAARRGLRVGARVPAEAVDRVIVLRAVLVDVGRDLPERQRGRVARLVEVDELVVGVGGARPVAVLLVVPPAEVDGAGELRATRVRAARRRRVQFHTGSLSAPSVLCTRPTAPPFPLNR